MHWEMVMSARLKPKTPPARLLAALPTGMEPVERASLEQALAADPAARHPTVAAYKATLE